jgi:hypothetical protein
MSGEPRKDCTHRHSFSDTCLGASLSILNICRETWGNACSMRPKVANMHRSLSSGNLDNGSLWSSSSLSLIRYSECLHVYVPLTHADSGYYRASQQRFSYLLRTTRASCRFRKAGYLGEKTSLDDLSIWRKQCHPHTSVPWFFDHLSACSSAPLGVLGR